MSEIAKKYGGGGHRGACGFSVKDISTVIHGSVKKENKTDSSRFRLKKIDKSKLSLWDIGVLSRLISHYSVKGGFLVGSPLAILEDGSTGLIIGFSSTDGFTISIKGLVHTVTVEELMLSETKVLANGKWLSIRSSLLAHYD